MQIILPDEEFIRGMHDAVISAFGGKSGDLHPEAITRAIERPKQYILYEECNFHTVCAVVLDTLANKHPFMDGNKRTALLVVIGTYRLNKITLDYKSLEQEDFVNLMLWVVNDHPSITGIAERLKSLINQYATEGARRALRKAEYNF